MLSIHKLTAGQDRYYLEQAGGRVDVIESIGDGVEEYYTGGATEAGGEWLGAGARQLGLEADVKGDALRHVLGGESPEGVFLRSTRTPVKIAGFDLTFSAPKSVSVLFAVGEPAVRDAIRAAHDRAVVEAITYLEGSASVVRRGAGGARVESANGLIVAAFRHRTSRAGDPQLHTHALVANLAQGTDGRWSTLDGRRIYAHARAASFVYQAVLRSELSCELGVTWRSVRDGIADIAGVPDPVKREFSRRRADIEDELERRGASGPRASEAAALTTRQPKNRQATVEQLAHGWRERASDLGFGDPEIARVLHVKTRNRHFGNAELEDIFEDLAAPTGLTLERSTFSRRDVVQSLAEHLPADQRVSAAVLEATADCFLGSEHVVPLVPSDADAEARLAFRRKDGRLLPLVREEWLYSTPELLALEQRVVETAVGGQSARAGEAQPDAVRQAIEARPTLGADQRAMLERLCLAGERVAVVVGKAGTGKTFALDAAREAWQASERPILGVAIARRTANQLQADAHIASTSVAALLADLNRHGGALPAGAVLVVDEAGMLPTRPLARLLDAVEAADGKLVLVGDHRQLPELEAGGAFRGLVRRGLAVELTENRRQRERWERTALDQLRAGDVDVAIAAYVEHDRIHVSERMEETLMRLVGDWHRSALCDDAVMIAPRRVDVADLNRLARALRRTSGDLAGPELTVGDASFAVGDIVAVRRNDLRLGVTNGERGCIASVDAEGGRLGVRFGNAVVTLDHNFLASTTAHGEPALTHAYAITGHIAQGATVDRAYVLADDALTGEAAYTALSRARASTHVYLTEQLDDPSAEFAPGENEQCGAIDRFADGLRRSRAQTLAIDAGQPDPIEQLARAQDELTAARAARAERESSRWRPGRRAGVVDARAAEEAAAARVQRLARVAAEHRHGAQPWRDATRSRAAADLHDRIVERQLDRSVERGRGIEL